MELDEILDALGKVQKELHELPSDAWAERYRLQKHQDGLREAADAFRSQHDPDEGRSDEALRAEAASLERRMKAMVGRTGGLVTSKGGGSQSPGSGAMAALEVQGKQQQAREIERMAARVNQIKVALDRRRST